MPATLEAGTINGYCVGEPWNEQAIFKKVGLPVITDYEIWKNNPEKVLGVTREWAQQFPQTHRALLAAVMAALQELGDRDVARELTGLLHRAQVVAVPDSWIELVLRGQGAGTPPRFASGLRAFPRRSQLMWCALQMLRWRQWDRPLSLAELTTSVCDVAAFCDAAATLEMPLPPR